MTNILNKLDQNLFLWMNSFHTSLLDPVMVFMSGQLIWLPFIAFFIWKGRSNLDKKAFGLFILFIAITLVLSDVTSSYIMKNLFTRLRPCRIDELKPLIHQFGQKCGGRFGFVSSHAANSVALVYFCLRSLSLPGRFHFIWILPALVGYSRIYLGVHFPGDIFVGSLVGLIWAALMAKAYQATTVRV